jgi:hypothetical protein
LPVLRRRKSTFIHGIEDDAREVIEHLSGYLAGDSQAPRIKPGILPARRDSLPELD